MDVTLYCGECAHVMAEQIPDGSIDLTLTSPPYDKLRTYNGYTFDFEAIAAQLWRVTKPGGVVVWVVADETVNGSESGTSFRQALGFMAYGFNLHDTMIYETPKPPMNDNRYQTEFEFMFVFSKGRVATFNPILVPSLYGGSPTQARYRQANGDLKDRHGSSPIKMFKVRGNIWRYVSGHDKSTNDAEAHLHPAIFPEALARDHIVSWSNPGDVVLDPMCGSGTTLKMAVLAQRRAIGIDISAEYVELTRQRVEAAQQQIPLFAVGNDA